MKNTFLMLLIAVLATPNYAQGGLLNRAKEALNKKAEKKEPTPAPTAPNESKPAAPTTAPTAATPAPDKATVPPPVVSEIGTIYFSNQPFTNGTEGSKTSFTSNEVIYGRLVLKQGTIREVLKPHAPTEVIKGPHLSLDVYVMASGRFQNELERKTLSTANQAVLAEADLDKNVWDFDVFPPPDKLSTMLCWNASTNCFPNNYIHRYLTDEIMKIPEGTYTFGITLKSAGVDFRGDPLPEEKQTQITNEFQLTFRGADYATIKANNAKITDDFENVMARRKYETQQLPPEWKMTSNPLLPGLTEAQLRTMYINHFVAKDRPDLQIVKFYARPAASSVLWTVQNNDLGIPRYRYTNQWFFMFVKNTRVNECFFQGFGLRQNYNGGGTFGPAFIDTNENPAWFKCERMSDTTAPAAAKPAVTKPAPARKP